MIGSAFMMNQKLPRLSLCWYVIVVTTLPTIRTCTHNTQNAIKILVVCALDEEATLNHMKKKKQQEISHTGDKT